MLLTSLGNKSLTFAQYIDREVMRFCDEKILSREEQFSLMLTTEPCLFEALMLQALSISLLEAKELAKTFDKLKLDDPYLWKNQMSNEWWKLISQVENIYGRWPEEPNGDELENYGFPARIVKYADNWHAVQYEEELSQEQNRLFRNKIIRLLDNGRLDSLDVLKTGCFVGTLDNFMKGTIEYSFVEIGELALLLRGY